MCNLYQDLLILPCSYVTVAIYCFPLRFLKMTVHLYKNPELMGEVRFDKTLSFYQCYLFSTKNAPDLCDGFIFCEYPAMWML